MAKKHLKLPNNSLLIMADRWGDKNWSLLRGGLCWEVVFVEVVFVERWSLLQSLKNIEQSYNQATIFKFEYFVKLVRFKTEI